MVQTELFKEFEHQTKRRKRASGSILPKNYILLNVSYEQVIFITIGVIMVMVLVFSLGVERGKRVGDDTPPQIKIVPALPQKPAPEPAEDAGAKGSAAPVKDEPVEDIPKEKTVKNAGLFTVQVIAYRSKKSAQKELIKLGKKGYKPFIILGGGYYQICVGEFKAHVEAEKALADIKKSHPDSFIRKR
jgi:hypothetical protein